MKLWYFSLRNAREILRDPVNLGFGLGFPLVLLGLMTLIQSNIPVDIFAIESLSPGIAVFGLSFLTLFSATLVARDRESAFLPRLYTTPMGVWGFLAGYALPILPMALGQSLVCYAAALILGLPISWNVALAVVAALPIALFHIALGLLCGSCLTVRQAGSVCGALLTNLSAWLSGAWFDLELVGGTFRKIAYALPFVHGVNLEKAVLAGRFGDVPGELAWVMAYALVTALAAGAAFLRQTRLQ